MTATATANDAGIPARWTATNIAALPVTNPARDTIIMEPTTPGFGVRVRPGKAPAWVHRCKVDGKARRVSLGRFPANPRKPAAGEMTLAQARQAHAASVAAIAAGEDPAPPRRPAAASGLRRPRRVDGPNLGAVVDSYLSAASKRLAPATVAEYENALKRNLGAAMALPVTGIGESLIDACAALESRGKARMAGKLAVIVSGVWEWAAKAPAYRKALDGHANPARTVRRPKVTRRVSAVLDMDELPDFMRALSVPFQAPHEGSDYWRDIFALTLFTGQRPGMVCGMRWDQIHGLDGSAPTWRFEAAALGRRPAADGPRPTKNRTDHSVPLSAPVCAILRARKRVKGSPFVFAARTRLGHAHIDSATENLRRVLAKMENPPARFTAHWLRKTASSYLEVLGATREIRDVILNHARPGMDGVYTLSIQGLDHGPRAFLARWADLLIAARDGGALWDKLGSHLAADAESRPVI